MKNPTGYIFLLCLLLSASIWAQKFTFEPNPEWVNEVDTIVESKVSKYDVVSGSYVSLLDYQINLENDTYFYHEVTNVISFSGITNASQLAISYDTSYQQLIIHHLYILRNGKKIDRTQDLKLEILNNEQNLHIGIYTGQITAYSILDDIRLNDRIDFAYSLIGHNPIFDDEKYLFIPLEGINPIDYYSLSVIYPKDRDYIYDCICDSSQITASVQNGLKQINIKLSNLEAIKLDEFMPIWLIPYDYFILSSLKNWREVNDWASNVFSIDDEQQLSEVFDEIFIGNENMNQKIDKIINYVQDDIRFMGIESGIGSIKPFSPEQVVKQRFGDCKDKSLLLVTLLKLIGVDKAYPALVSTYLQQNVLLLLPGTEVFDHCIVYFEYDSSVYWIDPSIAEQGGSFKNTSAYDYGKALIIGMPADSLHDMPGNFRGSQTYVSEVFDINSFDGPATLTIESKRFGYAADQRRSILEYFSTNEISLQVSANLGRVFPSTTESSKIEITDDLKENILTIKYAYKLEDIWIDGDEQNNDELKGMKIFKFEPVMIFDYLHEPSCQPRNYPMMVEYPLSLYYTVIFNFPASIIIDDDVDVFENEAFYYEEEVKQINPRTVAINYTLNTLTKEMSAENYVDICKQKKEITKELAVYFYFYNN